MKNIFSIFKRDLHGLMTNFFALVVAGGLCLLPALYAWFNIYSNWDPYGNTGNINIAVANLDEGWTNEKGEKLNMGDDLVEELKGKDSIGWLFMDTDQEAIDGVMSGQYYAALIINPDFTYSMYNGVMENIENPKITYYVNGKKNAVATKITDTAVGTVQTSINKQFIKAVTEQVFTEANGVSEDINSEDAVVGFMEKLEKVNEDLIGYDEMISSFVSGNQSLNLVTTDAENKIKQDQKKIDEGVAKLESGKEGLAADQKTFNEFSADLTATMNSIQASINSINTQISSAQLETDAVKLAEDMEQIQEDAKKLSDDLGTVSDAHPRDLQLKAAVKGAQAALKGITDVPIDTNTAATGTTAATKALTNSLDSFSNTIKSVQNTYDNNIVPQVSNMLESMGQTIQASADMLTALGKTTRGVGDILGQLNGTLDAANLTLGQLQVVIRNTSSELTDILNRLHAASVEEQIDIIMALLSGDPETLGEFFAEPVQVEANYIYEIANYGSGVAPFYTTLAIWVGMTILVSLIKVHARTDGLDNPAPAELFFGRYLLFFLLSQIQTLIIVLGNLYIFKIQCLYPFQFWVAAAMASFTFSILIYSLTLAFGDIGKALAVVVMVIQIAGSGGTYPIEALPSFFKAVYVFFPFPYAIDAMRECIGGMYQNKYGLCMVQLGLFVIAALVVGLVIRIPFIKVNHFIEERMEDTKML